MPSASNAARGSSGIQNTLLQAGTGSVQLGGNPTGFNLPTPTQTGLTNPMAATASSTQQQTIPTIPFSAYGNGQVQIPGAIGQPGGGSAANPYGGPAYTSTTDNALLGQLTSAFGEGAGDSLFNFLQSGAGYNPQVAQELLGQFQPQIARGEASLASQFGASGMGASSPAAIAQAAFEAESANQENTLLSQLYEQGVNNYMNTLMGVTGVGKNNTSMNQGGLMGDINSILGLASSGAGALSAAGVGGSSGTMATILSVLGAL